MTLYVCLCHFPAVILNNDELRKKHYLKNLLIYLFLQVKEVKVRTEGGMKPGQVICKIAADEKATMIVIGTRGMGKVRRTIMGSVSDYVVHHATCPVVVCRHASDLVEEK